jgi:hypothetical protein
MVVVPVAIPVTIPVLGFTVAIAVAVLLHTPPVAVVYIEIDEPEQTLVGPYIESVNVEEITDSETAAAQPEGMV